MDTPNTTPVQNPAPAAPAGSKKNIPMAVLAYIGILVAIPYFTAKEDPFVKFHIKQGLILLVIEVVVWMIAHVLWVFWPLWNLVSLATLVWSVIGIVHAAKSEEKPLPWVGHLADKFSI